LLADIAVRVTFWSCFLIGSRTRYLLVEGNLEHELPYQACVSVSVYARRLQTIGEGTVTLYATSDSPALCNGIRDRAFICPGV